MARIPYVSRETMPDGRTDLYDRLVRERGANPENVFLALANVPDLAEAVLGMATALRKQTTLPRVFREFRRYRDLPQIQGSSSTCFARRDPLPLAASHGGSLELPTERTTLLLFDSARRPAWLPAP